MWIIDEQRPQTTAKSLARMLYPDPGGSATPRNGWHGGLAGLLHHLAARITAMSERRATVKQLAEMSDRELAELGLSRGRLHGVFELKFARASSSRPRFDGLKTQAELGGSLLRPLAG